MSKDSPPLGTSLHRQQETQNVKPRLWGVSPADGQRARPSQRGVRQSDIGGSFDLSPPPPAPIKEINRIWPFWTDLSIIPSSSLQLYANEAVQRPINKLCVCVCMCVCLVLWHICVIWHSVSVFMYLCWVHVVCISVCAPDIVWVCVCLCIILVCFAVCVCVVSISVCALDIVCVSESVCVWFPYLCAPDIEHTQQVMRRSQSTYQSERGAWLRVRGVAQSLSLFSRVASLRVWLTDASSNHMKARPVPGLFQPIS